MASICRRGASVWCRSTSWPEIRRGTWVIEDFRPPLRYDGRVDTSVLALRQAPGTDQTQNRLYQNMDGGAFHEVTVQTGTGDLGYAWGAQWAITTATVARIST